MIEEWKLAYAFGLIDGEGCISINQPHNRGFFSLNVEVTMSDEEPIKFLFDTFGGYFQVKITRTVNNRVMYRWGLQSEKAQKFLKLIQPFIIGKVMQVGVALDFPVGSKDGIQLYGNGRKIPQNIIDLRFDCWEMMKELKAPPTNTDLVKVEG